VRKAANLTSILCRCHGYLNFLEPSGPLQACNGIALPLSFEIVFSALYLQRNKTTVSETTTRQGKGKGYPATGRGGPRGSGYVKIPDILDIRHCEGGRSSAICTGRFYSRRNPWYSFSGAESTPGHMVRIE